MQQTVKPVKRFFLGCSTQQGFWGCFDKLLQPQSGLTPYLIKAGPGCGKSSMMRRIGSKLAALGYSCEYIHCGSDPDSLDGLICQKLGFALLDATAPHALDPAFPAAHEQVVSFYDCLSSEKLAPHAETLYALGKQRAAAMRSTRRLITAAAALYEEVSRSAAASVQREKLSRYLQGLCHRELPRRSGKGTEHIRLCTNFTPQGFTDFREADFAACRRIILCDRYGAVSRTALAKLREYALENGYDTVTCPDPLAPESRIAALYIPQQNLCIMADGIFGSAPREGAKCIHTARFCRSEELAAMRAQLRFMLRGCGHIMQQACANMDTARRLHLQTEGYYSAAMDFSALQEKENALFAQILARNAV
ncbi:MAG: hypothetical protein IKV55_05045 [Oscillospiraceae bacterium]|nr:hypothetical protein [Oscillospiraceae bacterium]